ncbi:MAG: hypothetical protein Q9M91_05800 [Candidatus Dojkabacteria bacterium]|nr:hypothetical protein [Candidatus Dojkabacteria bacterium]MDQ7021313.1 hypothetical protein [Candidatus Dojkabacteria bacterium]
MNTIRKVQNKITGLIIEFRIITYVLVFSITTYFSIGITHAQNLGYKIPNPSKFNSLEEIISAAASLIRPLFLLTFGAFIIVGAITLTTSRGEAEKVESAKKTITAAIVGFVIAVFAPSIANLVLGLLGADGLGLFGP